MEKLTQKYFRWTMILVTWILGAFSCFVFTFGFFLIIAIGSTRNMPSALFLSIAILVVILIPVLLFFFFTDCITKTYDKITSRVSGNVYYCFSLLSVLLLPTLMMYNDTFPIIIIIRFVGNDAIFSTLRIKRYIPHYYNYRFVGIIYYGVNISKY